MEQGSSTRRTKGNPAATADLYASDEPQPVLAKRYGDNRNTISMIRHGRCWLTQSQDPSQGDAA